MSSLVPSTRVGVCTRGVVPVFGLLVVVSRSRHPDFDVTRGALLGQCPPPTKVTWGGSPSHVATQGQPYLRRRPVLKDRDQYREDGCGVRLRLVDSTRRCFVIDAGSRGKVSPFPLFPESGYARERHGPGAVGVVPDNFRVNTLLHTVDRCPAPETSHTRVFHPVQVHTTRGSRPCASGSHQGTWYRDHCVADSGTRGAVVQTQNVHDSTTPHKCSVCAKGTSPADLSVSGSSGERWSRHLEDDPVARVRRFLSVLPRKFPRRPPPTRTSEGFWWTFGFKYLL